MVKVTFRTSSENESSFLYRQVNGKQIACPSPSPVRLPTGKLILTIYATLVWYNKVLNLFLTTKYGINYT